MSKIPRKARIFLWIIYCLGGLSVLVAFTLLPRIEKTAAQPRETWLLPLFVIGAVASGQRKIRLFGKDEDAGTMSLSFAVIYASLLHFGPQRALLTSVASTLATCLLQPKEKRQPLFQASFNVSVGIIELVAAGTAFLLINRGTVALDGSHSPTALCAAALVFFFCNTFSVATIIGLCTEENPLSVWRESFLWTAPSFFFGAGAATAVTFLSQVVVHNPATSAITLVCLGLVLYLLHATYKMNVARTDALIGSKEQLANLYLSTIRSLALAIDAKDRYTHQHILRVQRYAVATARAMGVEGDELRAIETGALLHDIGKLGVPEYILVKPGRLTSDELAKIKTHPQIGADILDPVEFPWPVLPVVKYHHERLDGSGYPEGLKGDAIPRTARILAVADVYDALTSNRSYRNAWTHERALAEIQRCSGTDFDPIAVDAFTRVIDNVREEMAAQNLASHADLALTAASFDVAPTLSSSALMPDELQRAAPELWGLYDITETLSASLGLHETAHIIAARLQTIFPGTGCVILTASASPVEPEPQALTACAAVGLGERFFMDCRTLSPQSLSLRVVSIRESYRGLYDHDDLMPNSITDGAWVDLKSALIVPIVHEDRVLGTVNLYHPDPEAFDGYAQSLLEMIAERTAPALFRGMLDERARGYANFDPLTGLANLRLLGDTIGQKIRRGPEGRFALLCLDIDQFGAINDVYGHEKGDAILCELGEVLLAAVGPKNLVARCGGGEYAVLIDTDGEQEVELAVRKLQDAVADYDPGLRHPRIGDLHVEINPGTACFPSDGSDGNTLLSVARKRMRANRTDRKLGLMAGNATTSNEAYLPARLSVAAARPNRFR